VSSGRHTGGYSIIPTQAKATGWPNFANVIQGGVNYHAPDKYPPTEAQ